MIYNFVHASRSGGSSVWHHLAKELYGKLAIYDT